LLSRGNFLLSSAFRLEMLEDLTGSAVSDKPCTSDTVDLCKAEESLNVDELDLAMSEISELYEEMNELDDTAVSESKAKLVLKGLRFSITSILLIILPLQTYIYIYRERERAIYLYIYKSLQFIFSFMFVFPTVT